MAHNPALARGALAEDARTAAQPYWNPYLVGLVLGLVLLATYLVTGRGLGASSAFAAASAWIAGLFSVEHVLGNPVHARYWNEGAPLLSWTVFLLIGSFAGAWLSARAAGRFAWKIEHGPRVSDGQRLLLAFVGGLIAAYGARLARGCTSGQALTGGAVLNTGALTFMVAVFVAAYAGAWFMRKEWI